MKAQPDIPFAAAGFLVEFGALVALFAVPADAGRSYRRAQGLLHHSRRDHGGACLPGVAMAGDRILTIAGPGLEVMAVEPRRRHLTGRD